MRNLSGVWVIIAGLMLMSCGGGGSSISQPNPPPPPPPPPPPSNVIISGTITFDYVPFNPATNGLDYNNIQTKPARGVIVEIVNSSGTVLDTVNTDDSGAYSFTVNSNTSVRIQAKAHILQTTGAKWDVSVTDNTSGNALYTLAGSLTSSGAADSTRNLNAASGWGGSGYTSTRAAAPFAILDPIYTAVQKFAAVDADIIFPPVEFRWSVNNRAVGGNRENGDIGTSSYVGSGTDGNVYLLGDDNSDTDEYDKHVVIHEWGHYFEDRLSRSDSLGGSWNSSAKLDPRLAFGEGYGNALSGMILDDPIYRDSSGNQQASGFSIDVENNTNTNTGWFNAGSVQSILYDLYDNNSDGADVISLGLGPIYEVLTATNYIDNSLLVSIFTFVDELKAQQPANVVDIDALLTAQNIDGTGADGAGETNDGNIVSALPVYKVVVVGGAAVEICSVNDEGTYNRLGNRAFLTLDITTADTYNLVMTRTSGDSARDPDFNIWRAGAIIQRAISAPSETESWSGNLTAGSYVIDAFDFFNIDSADTTRSGDACYSFQVTN